LRAKGIKKKAVKPKATIICLRDSRLNLLVTKNLLKTTIIQKSPQKIPATKWVSSTAESKRLERSQLGLGFSSDQRYKKTSGGTLVQQSTGTLRGSSQ